MLTLAGAGCTYTAPKPQDLSILQQQAAQLKIGAWQIINDRLVRREDENIASSTARLIVYRFSRDRFDLTVENATSTGFISDWRAAYPQATAIINAEYFLPDKSPAGYLISHGQVINKSTFDLARSAFLIGGTAARIDSLTATSTLTQAGDIIQSYPLLIKNTQPNVPTESGLHARRSFIGFDSSGNLYLGVVTGGDITLHELANYLASMKVSWQNVLNLDGGPSTGISVSQGDWHELLDSATTIPNVIIVK